MIAECSIAAFIMFDVKKLHICTEWHLLYVAIWYPLLQLLMRQIGSLLILLFA